MLFCFDARARSFSPWLWLDLHRSSVLMAGALAFAGLGAWIGSAVRRDAGAIGPRPRVSDEPLVA